MFLYCLNAAHFTEFFRLTNHKTLVKLTILRIDSKTDKRSATKTILLFIYLFLKCVCDIASLTRISSIWTLASTTTYDVTIKVTIASHIMYFCSLGLKHYVVTADQNIIKVTIATLVILLQWSSQIVTTIVY